MKKRMNQILKTIVIEILTCIAIAMSVGVVIVPYVLFAPWIMSATSIWERLIIVLEASGTIAALAVIVVSLWVLISSMQRKKK